MHVNLLLGTPEPKYEPFITHIKGSLKQKQLYIITVK